MKPTKSKTCKHQWVKWKDLDDEIFIYSSDGEVERLKGGQKGIEVVCVNCKETKQLLYGPQGT